MKPQPTIRVTFRIETWKRLRHSLATALCADSTPGNVEFAGAVFRARPNMRNVKTMPPDRMVVIVPQRAWAWAFGEHTGLAMLADLICPQSLDDRHLRTITNDDISAAAEYRRVRAKALVALAR